MQGTFRVSRCLSELLLLALFRVKSRSPLAAPLDITIAALIRSHKQPGLDTYLLLFQRLVTCRSSSHPIHHTHIHTDI
jgi:hypothetical protein